ncbi:MAG: hypothetical protein P4K98_01260 [Bryobacteraceae bacterium]|nr:hypothetical protein [Bryobacteraceae bacterium]
MGWQVAPAHPTVSYFFVLTLFPAAALWARAEKLPGATLPPLALAVADWMRVAAPVVIGALLDEPEGFFAMIRSPLHSD